MSEFVFRTDASRHIGTGHVIRCLTLAQKLRDQGANCHFVCREHPGNLLTRLQEHGFQVTGLPFDDRKEACKITNIKSSQHYKNWLGEDLNTDMIQTIEILKKNRPNWLVIDHYTITRYWEKGVRPYCDKIMVIDDLANRFHECDLLLDQNLVKDLEIRYDRLTPSGCIHLLGSRYALLQSEYEELYARIPPKDGGVRRILIYFGGADIQNLTGKAIDAFLAVERPDIKVDVVLNSDGANASAVRMKARNHQLIKIHENLPSLAPLIAQADLAVGAGGCTTWERCALGLPTLLITVAANQIPAARELDSLGAVRFLGHQDMVSVENIRDALISILANETKLNQWSKKCRTIVDARGTKRVAKRLLEI